uniref:Uncharacterized protein n=2 Tax=Oryza sativa subsp. japonica TaxID=39947 RepID=Q53LW8_ORYSJ|nr:hypothetical protein LOC_Os11g20100 [Oryza sativa Japonica Group]ABA93022.1 hypothetical protein LOC_Os11g20100 [Oryza sativa Japonica Group]
MENEATTSLSSLAGEPVRALVGTRPGAAISSTEAAAALGRWKRRQSCRIPVVGGWSPRMDAAESITPDCPRDRPTVPPVFAGERGAAKLRRQGELLLVGERERTLRPALAHRGREVEDGGMSRICELCMSMAPLQQQRNISDMILNT